MRSMTTAQKSILSLLVHGGSLTAEQIAKGGGMLGLRTRIALVELKARGAIMASPFSTARYQITTSGTGLAVAHGLHRKQSVA